MKGVSRRCCSRTFVFMTLKSQAPLDSCENVLPVLVSRKLNKNNEAQTIIKITLSPPRFLIVCFTHDPPLDSCAANKYSSVFATQNEPLRRN